MPATPPPSGAATHATARHTPPAAHAQGSAFYLGGCAVVVYGWTIVGLILEVYGFWLLFCEFFPTVLQFFRKVPFLGKVLDMPVIKWVSSRSRTWAGTGMRGALSREAPGVGWGREGGGDAGPRGIL